ncbi:MAG TPA: hypothetical protein VHW23_39575 [Kofleriaceae bacterium]|jgi:hypothetical protein|nr:hypothetical protein [Kofleriaceae bacterium]
MTEPFHQDPEGISSRAIGVVAAAVVAISAGLVVIAWLLVVPVPATRPAAAPSPLERGEIDIATGGAQIRAAGAHELERAAWVDHGAGVVRIPIELAIEAVIADPRLIGTPSPGFAQAPEAR